MRLLHFLCPPPGGAVLQAERRRLHRLVSSVQAAGVGPLTAAGRPALPGPSGSPCWRGAARRPASLRLQAVHQLEVRASPWWLPPCHPQLLRAEDQGGISESGRTLQRLHAHQNRLCSDPKQRGALKLRLLLLLTAFCYRDTKKKKCVKFVQFGEKLHKANK